MLYSTHKSIQDAIVETLIEMPANASSIHASLSETRVVSIQAVYDALKKLSAAGVILKHKKIYSVTSEWRTTVVNTIRLIPEPPRLEQGESQRYEFNSSMQLDLYWKHLNAELSQSFPDQPVFFYDPHEIWIYNNNRQASQAAFLQTVKQNGRSAYMLIGGETQFDYLYKNNYSKYLSIHLDGKTPFKRNEHLTIAGDYVVTTKLPAPTASEIDKAYDVCENEESLKEKLSAVFSRKNRMVVTITKDRGLAKKLRKRIAKDMYVPLSEREKYFLF